MSKKIYFDLDGTLADLYNRKNWLDDIENERSGVFKDLPTIVNFDDSFFLLIDELLRDGWGMGVITWTPMQASPEYEEVCRQEKLEWIRENLPFVTEINIVPYGVPKQKAIQKRAKKMVLIDDNADVVKMWNTKIQREGFLVDDNYTVVDALVKICDDYL